MLRVLRQVINIFSLSFSYSTGGITLVGPAIKLTESRSQEEREKRIQMSVFDEACTTTQCCSMHTPGSLSLVSCKKFATQKTD